eukprot:TRINITY_DN10887_c0_g2_i1.p1 TRINITY_DN10887_c0_g2~~TRINITY_DN10887_c0_g2_i1.p1  ORF type:complete len:230 (-),score=43.66 TRINITY_DN10887_c0_g2_i1:36-725(-)
MQELSLAPDLNQGETEEMLKIVLLGDAGVGKTSLLNQYTKGKPPSNSQPTIGLEFITKTIVLSDGSKRKVQVWDTAGQERYKALTSAHFRKAAGAILVYDVTRRKTFDHILKWHEELTFQAEEDTLVMLIGNKTDISDQDPTMYQVQKKEGSELAKTNNFIFMETTATRTDQVNSAFLTLIERIHENRRKKHDYGGGGGAGAGAGSGPADASRRPVSYTHLTLPTIYSV